MRREAALLLALAGCTPVEMRGGAPDQACAADPVQGAIGMPASTGAIEGLRRRSGARTVRIVRPGEAATMDFRADRLTVTVEGHGLITRLVCG